jgi:thioredoxin-related protein
MKKLLFLFLIALASCTTSTINVKVPSNILTPSVIYFSSEHCGWCRKFDPNWKIVKSENFTDITFYKDSELYNESELVDLFGISSVPALVFIDKNKNITKMVGYQSESEFRENVKKISK